MGETEEQNTPALLCFLEMALFIAYDQNILVDIKLINIHKNVPVCFGQSRQKYLHIDFHGLLVQGYVNELHPKIMCCFVKRSMDTHWCNTSA